MALFNPPRITILGASAVRVNHTGNTTKTTLATIVVPANAMGINGRLRITALWSNNNNANNKSVFIDFGSTTWVGSVNTTSISQYQQTVIANRASTSSQVGFGGIFGGFGASGSVATTATIDTTAAQSVALAVQLANAADNCAIEHYLVELIRP